MLWEILVIDNAGESATETEVKTWTEKIPVHYLVEPKNGKNNALNHAIPKIKGELVVLVDDDILADINWLQEIRSGAARWPDHMVFGGRILPDWPDGFEPPDMQNPYLAGAYGIADWGREEKTIGAKEVFGANMVVRRVLFDQGWTFNGNVGPTAGKIYTMGSETEFLLRLAELGHQFIYLPAALVYHQIRPGQMNVAWLKNRAYRAGLSGVCLDQYDNDYPKIFGVPRYLFRMIFEAYLKLILLKMTSSNKKLEIEMRIQHLFGQIVMNRHMAREKY
jgi:glycosyltransferase involved in cell wall biosynthesis